MAVEHIIPVDEPTDGHTFSRKCKCGPEVKDFNGGKYVYHAYMNKKEENNG